MILNDPQQALVEALFSKRGVSSNSSFLMPTDESYDRMRRDFEELEFEKQAQFLIQASASTLAKGIEQVGRALADGLGDVMHRRRRSSGTSGPGAAEPETAQRQTPKNGSSSKK
jgi:hypothetical protein